MSSIPKFNDVLDYYLQNGNGFAFEKFDGTMGLSSLDTKTSDGTIEDSMVVLGSDKKPIVNVSYTDSKNIITQINVRYQKITPLDNQYGAIKYLIKSSSGNWDTNFNLVDSVGTWGDYAGLLDIAKGYIENENVFTFDADGIRDEATAERLARKLILLRYKPLARIDMRCDYQAMKYEVGDVVEINLSSLPLTLNDNLYKVIATRPIPNLSGQAGMRLVLLEIGEASIPDIKEWVEGANVGDSKIEGANTGTISMEVG